MDTRHQRCVQDEVRARRATDRLDIAWQNAEREGNSAPSAVLSTHTQQLLTLGWTTCPPCVRRVSRVISSWGFSSSVAFVPPSFPSRCKRNVVMFFEYIWLA